MTSAEPGVQDPPRQALHSQEQSDLLFPTTGVTLSQDNVKSMDGEDFAVVDNPAALLTEQWEVAVLSG